jgi:tRNA(adenine34) deaminase
MSSNDEKFMLLALEQAQMAAEKDEVPVGAIIVCNKQVIARAYNQTELLNDVTAHAEIIATTIASSHLGSKFLDECELYVTLEPCPMCAGALYWARYKRVIFGAKDPKRGYQVFSSKMLHPKTEVVEGVLKKECSELLVNFFKKKRL